MGKAIQFLFFSWFLVFLAGCSVEVIPEMPEEANRHMVRGKTAVENAASDSDLESAVKEFQKAAELAPNFPSPYYNSGMVRAELGEYQSAIGDFKKYLELSSKAEDATAVQEKIYELEYLIENPPQEEAPAYVPPEPVYVPELVDLGPNWNDLAGKWYSDQRYFTWQIGIYGSSIEIIPDELWYNNRWNPSGNARNGEKYDGTINDYQLSGTYTQPFMSSRPNCCPTRNWNFSGTISTDMQTIYLTYGYGHCGFDGQACGDYIYEDLEKKLTRSSDG